MSANNPEENPELDVRDALEFDGAVTPDAAPPVADEIVEAVLRGREIHLRDATIAGDLNLDFVQAAAPLSFEGCRFQGLLTADHASFSSDVSFTASEFLDAVSLRKAAFSSILNFDGSTFHSDCAFDGADIGYALLDDDSDHRGEFSALGATIGGPASFNKTQFQKVVLDHANFAQVTVFEGCVVHGDFRCVSSKFNSALVLDKSTFESRAVFHLCTIDGDLKAQEMTTSGDVFLFDSVTVAGDASFERSNFGSENRFRGSVFKGDASIAKAKFQKHTNFSRILVSGSFDAREAQFLASKESKATAVYINENTFSHAAFRSDARFEGAEFHDQVYFNWAVFGGLAGFGLGTTDQRKQAGLRGISQEPTVFHGPVSFGSSEFATDAQFGGTSFEDEAEFNGAWFHGSNFFTGVFQKEALFTRARFDSGLMLGAQFLGSVKLDSMIVAGQLLFGLGCRFHQDLRLRLTSTPDLRIVEATETVFSNFKGRLDLLACKYESITSKSPIERFWTLIRDKLRQQAFAEETSFDTYSFSRQPYLQFEKICRRLGHSAVADDVLFEMRIVEGKLIRLGKNPREWFLDRLFKYLSGYGVRLRYVLIWMSLSLMLGLFVFTRPGAVRPRSESGPAITAALPEEIERFKVNDREWSLGFSGQAVTFTLRSFLPFDIPAARYWEPSERRILVFSAATWASLLKCLGWILLPTLVGEVVRKVWARKD